jgi:hypothetical protein
MLALPKVTPLALRAQANIQGRQAREVGTTTCMTYAQNSAEGDFQSPYLIKLLSQRTTLRPRHLLLLPQPQGHHRDQRRLPARQ